jgi:hypothetical protein
MRARRLKVLDPIFRTGRTGESGEPQALLVGKPAPLGVLSIHFEGGRCRVRCPFCYLGRREGAVDDDAEQPGLDVELALEAALALEYRELAVTLSEPIERALQPLRRLLQAATVDRPGGARPVAVTTTLAVLESLPSAVSLGLERVGRLNLSIDPWKGPCTAAAVGEALKRVRAGWSAERVLIVTLSTPRFAEELFHGELAALLALPEVDRVALNALKPPRSWCDRAFWLGALSRLRPLLREHLDRRLFLDCYVAARILGIGDCPARPDLSPAANSPGTGTGLAFRSCVYQPAPDFVAGSSAELSERLRDFTVPAACPFPIP